MSSIIQENLVRDFRALDEKYQSLCKSLRPANKAALFDALHAADITFVRVQFDGSGDSGQIENMEATAGEKIVELPDGSIEIAQANWGEDHVERSTLPIHDAVEALVYNFLGETYAGWDTDDGAFGTFTFDVALRTITLEYNERISDSEYSEHVF